MAVELSRGQLGWARTPTPEQGIPPITLSLKTVPAPSSRCCILGCFFLICAGFFKLLKYPGLPVEPTFPFQLYQRSLGPQNPIFQNTNSNTIFTFWIYVSFCKSVIKRNGDQLKMKENLSCESILSVFWSHFEEIKMDQSCKHGSVCAAGELYSEPRTSKSVTMSSSICLEVVGPNQTTFPLQVLFLQASWKYGSLTCHGNMVARHVPPGIPSGCTTRHVWAFK